MPREDEKNPLGWVEDQVLTDHILDCLESSEGPDYVYTISVQGHGAYPDEPLLEDPGDRGDWGKDRCRKITSGNITLTKIHEMDKSSLSLSRRWKITTKMWFS